MLTILALVWLWRAPTWRLLLALTAGLGAVDAALYWANYSFYANTAKRYPIVGERWLELVGSGIVTLLLFVAVGATIVTLRKWFAARAQRIAENPSQTPNAIVREPAISGPSAKTPDNIVKPAVIIILIGIAIAGGVVFVGAKPSSNQTTEQALPAVEVTEETDLSLSDTTDAAAITELNAAVIAFTERLRSEFPDTYTAIASEVSASRSPPGTAFLGGSRIMAQFMDAHADDFGRAETPILVTVADRLTSALRNLQRENAAACANLLDGEEVQLTAALSLSNTAKASVGLAAIAKMDAIISAKKAHAIQAELTENELDALFARIPTTSLQTYLASGDPLAYAQFTDAQRCSAQVDIWSAIAALPTPLKARATAQELISLGVGRKLRASLVKP